MSDIFENQARAIFMAGVEAADPEAATKRALEDRVAAGRGAPDLLIAVGKAAGKMAGAAIAALGAPERAMVVTNYENAAPLAGVEVFAAGHPVPDEGGEAAGRAVLQALEEADENTDILCLISGGGSALLPCPVDGVSLEDKAEVNRLLLGSGADITAMNLVRQQLSRLKGGGMLRAAAPARIEALILSDVVGDDLRAIASGPTVAPIGTRGEAREMLEKCKIWEALPEAVRAHLAAPAPDAPPLPAAQNRLIGSNAISVAAMERAAPGAALYPAPLEGEVAEAAARVIASARPGVTLFGGETTVELRGTGMGGRNQELALRVALLAEAAGWDDYAFLSGGTDGRDGPTDAAGGLVTPATLPAIRAAGHDPEALLANNDSYHALKAGGALLTIGATGTNVADLQVLILPG